MDVIRLEIGNRLDISDELVDETVIFVNDRNLIDLVRKAEPPFASREGKANLAGSYVGLPPEDVFPPSRRLLGEPANRYDNDPYDGKLAVLGCGVVGLWPLRVEITLRENVVIWCDFERPSAGAGATTAWDRSCSTKRGT